MCAFFAPASAPPPALGPLAAAIAALPRLLAADTRIVVGTSGGPDSQALLHLLAGQQHALGLTLWAVGVDHGLRMAAAAELDVAEDLAQALDVPFSRHTVQLAQRGNLLARARTSRYALLQAVAKQVGAQVVAVAHIADDQAETLLFHLARGSGLRGAAGMAARRGALARPLLKTTRAQVLAYLAYHRIPFAQDPSNRSLRRMRGRLRAQVAPGLKAVNAGWVQHMAAFTERARCDEAFLQQAARRAWRASQHAKGGLDVERLRHYHVALWPRVFALWLKATGARLDAAAIARLVQAVRAGEGPIAQGQLSGVLVRRLGARMWATPVGALPPRRAGTLPRR